jgi:EAL domain-containing protein (putative c-di-GMP-specific phosphodiesterase class I)
LQHLNRLPISTVKIDRSFVQRLCENTGSSVPIVEAIIAMGHSLNMQVIAEGVENNEQMKVLHRLGCDAIQGFLLARPVGEAEIEARLSEGDKIAVNF